MLGCQIIWAVALVQCFVLTLASPVDLPIPVTQKRSRVDLFRNETKPACTTKDGDGRMKNGLTDTTKRWKAFNVQPDPAYNSQERSAINDAMYYLSKVIPCVSFGIWPSNAKPTGDYIYILKGTDNGCNSAVGRQGGKQTMNLQSPGCMSVATVMHEMIHALGFYHEQSREDRDDYVTVHFENVEPGKEHNFNKYTGPAYSSFGVAYNPKSLMHYNTYDFSVNGKPTITTKDGGEVGSDDTLQETDKQKLKNMYKC